MKKPDSWMPFYIGDYLRDTMGLRREDHGSYLLLMMAYWANGGPLPDDDQALRNICRCPDAEWCRTKGVLSKYFIQEDGVWRHKRIDAELADAKREYQAQCERTKKATEARLEKQKDVTTHVTSDVTTHVTSTQPQPQPQPQVQPQPLGVAHVTSGDGNCTPSWQMCQAWLATARSGGADYTVSETKSAFLALQAGGWMWGKRPVSDYRAALERQIQTDRTNSKRRQPARGPNI